MSLPTGRADISELKIFPNDSLVRLLGDTFSQFWWYRCLGIQKNNQHAKGNFKIIPFGTFIAFVYPEVCNFRLFTIGAGESDIIELRLDLDIVSESHIFQKYILDNTWIWTCTERGPGQDIHDAIKYFMW